MNTKIKVIHGHEIWEEDGNIIKDIKLWKGAEEIVLDLE